MKLTATVYHDQSNTQFVYTDKVLLSHILADAGLTQSHPCGGVGKCGKCAIRVAGDVSPLEATEKEALQRAGYDPADGWRLSCLCTARGDVSLYYNTSQPALQGLLAGFSKEFSLCPPRPGRGIGMAVDIGTTPVAASLYDLEGGKLLDSACCENPQKVHGADVISRVGFALSGGAKTLRDEIEDCLGAMARDMSARAGVEEPDTVVAVGNTAMLHLLTCTDPSPLSAAPFVIKRRFGEWEGGRYYPPCISAYVGADMTAAILASDMCREDKTSLLLDVGTNGEMALWHGGRLLCCSTAAGPAFEGAGISCGSLAIPGAICAVTAADGSLRCET